MMQSGLVFKMQYKIKNKLEAVGATSREKAVTIEEAGFNLQERNWLNYVAGGLVSKVRKTRDKRYYVTGYKR
jgi:hypothetical protein